jgi:4'-phosphopantetheinyl transferase
MIYWLWQASAGQADLARGVCPPGLLNADEYEQFARLATEKRRHDWLLGRRAAKTLLWAISGAARPALELEAFAIARQASGAPVGLVPNHAPWALSISHCQGQAVCAAADQPEAVVGIDLDRVEARSAEFVEDYFTDEEINAVSALPASSYDAGVMATWIAKEAALKALATGLTVDTRTVSCRPDMGPREAAGWRRLDVAVDEIRLGRPAPPLAGWWRPMPPWAVAVVTSRDEAAEPPRFCGTG